MVTLSLSGYEQAQISIEPSGMNGWIWGNLVFGGLIGILIDSVDGAATNLKPGEINVTLVALKSAQLGEPDRVCAVLSAAGPDGKTVARSFALKATESRRSSRSSP